jgi:hypothetical protein
MNKEGKNQSHSETCPNKLRSIKLKIKLSITHQQKKSELYEHDNTPTANEM